MERVLSIQSRGRYFTSGKISEAIRAVWIVFHGYGMRADSFLNQFECVVDDHTLVVAPEGPHRFYGRGTRGNVAANWMTSDMREHDIETNIQFLNQVLQDLFESGISEEVQLGILGFSQGGPTSFRWVAQLNNTVDLLIAWGTDLPKDVYTDLKRLQKINDSNIKLVVGDSDEYISTEQVDDMIMELHEYGVDFDFHTYSGKHEIHEETMRYFHARLVDDKSEY